MQNAGRTAGKIHVIRLLGIVSFLLSVVLATLAPRAGAAAWDVNVLDNGGFETMQNGKPTGWQAKGQWTGSITTVSEAAYEGAFGLKLTSSDKTDYWVKQTVPVEGGTYYELSSWLNVIDISGSGRAITKVEFYKDTLDAAGALGDQWSSPVLATNGWVQTGLVARAPDEANLASVYVRMYGPGTAYFDDVSFRPIPYSGMDMRTDAVFYYEDLNAGYIDVTAHLDDGMYADKTIDMTIAPKTGGAAVVQSSGLPAAEQFRYTFDPSVMTLHIPYTVTAQLRDSSNEVLLETVSTIYRWERPAQMQPDGTFVVDGGPFFPRIGYHVEVEDYAAARETVNTVQGVAVKKSISAQLAYLDQAHENGLKVFFPIYPQLREMEGPGGYAYIDQIVTALKDHPAIMGWMVVDEPNLLQYQLPNLLEDLENVYVRVRTLDPVHPLYMTISSADDFGKFGRFTDVLVLDPYPLPSKPISTVTRHVQTAKELYPNKPIWTILQTFQLPPSWPYLPQIGEVRNMAYQAILQGATALGYYAYTDPGWDLIDSALYPGLQSFTSNEVPHLSKFVPAGQRLSSYTDEHVQWGVWETEEELYVMAVNVTQTAQQTTVTLPQAGYRANTIAPVTSQFAVGTSSLDLTLAAGEARLIRLTPLAAVANTLVTLVAEGEQNGDITAIFAADLRARLALIQSILTAGDAAAAWAHLTHFVDCVNEPSVQGQGLITAAAAQAMTRLVEAQGEVPVDMGTVSLVKNAGFERFAGTRPATWSATGSWNNSAVAVTTEQARGTSSHSLNMTLSNTSNVYVMQPIAVVGGQTYELSAWLKGTVAGSGRAVLKVEYYEDTIDISGARGEVTSPAFGSKTDWEQVSLMAQVPAEANKVMVYLRLYGPGTIYYDDARFEAVAQ